jgi:hypothetical protein
MIMPAMVAPVWLMEREHSLPAVRGGAASAAREWLQRRR